MNSQVCLRINFQYLLYLFIILIFVILFVEKKYIFYIFINIPKAFLGISDILRSTILPGKYDS